MKATYITQSPEETKALARNILTQIPPGSVIALTGDLGSGKTTFTQGVAAALGVQDTVLSPTFKLISHYEGKETTLYHIDCYRLRSMDEFLNIGGEHYLLPEKGYTFIEWADVIRDILPADTIEITFQYHKSDPDARQITVARSVT
ncbi:MAG: tRNA (adenosine(37)-N6)-threonylcarbamoyltransferase complex ATPase subunit type 1 TsaE [Fidelibacterota bacterium]